MPHASLLRRKIIHVDMDAFYASVEYLDHPQLVGQPLVVGGSAENRGVVAAASYAARAFGVKSAMPMRRAMTLCPQLVILPPRFHRYTEISQQIREIFHRYTQLVEPLSLDEAYLDVTESTSQGRLASELAAEIRKVIFSETRLASSAGVAPNKLLAKIASDLAKPAGIKVIPPQMVKSFMLPLPIDRIHGVGPVTARKLVALGLRTCGDVQRAGAVRLKSMLGVRTGEWLWEMAHGIDEREVSADRERKSIGAETTFSRDLFDLHDIQAALASLAQEIYESVADRQIAAQTLTLKVRFSDFATITRSSSFPMPVCSEAEFKEASWSLLARVPRQPVRLLGLTLSRLSPLAFQPKSLFDEP